MVPQKTILVVEDNLINRMILKEILSPEYEVLEAENGLEALDVLARQKREMSLILLDINMPVMDGYTFLDRVKSDTDYASIPVIVTTQSDSESDEVMALSKGAADFVAKPYKPQIILHRAANIIHLRESAAMINLVQYDRLTGLYNKEFFYRRVKETIARNPDVEYDIVCSDIENFKFVNDIFGIQTGDAILRKVAEICRTFVGNHGFCGRFNADQFVCMLEHRQEYSDEYFIYADEEVNVFTNVKNVMIKWGIYHIKDKTLNVEQMCDWALLAANSIKKQYSKHFATYDDDLRNRLLREKAITDGMEPALNEGQFEIYLQPKYSIMDNSLAGAEALVRWNHPEWGFQSPAQFIPLFEQNGFITRLDQYIWDRACAVIQQWDAKGCPPIAVSVNVSRADIYNVDVVDILLRTVEKYGLSASRLHLEITESAYTEKPEQIIQTVSQLRELGFVIELDDFGSGYSSLNMLHNMPVDVLKLDMKFIQSETAKPISQGIMHFIMELARWMNLSVVAEGVETKEQLERLQEIGCDYVQGYYFARPMPVDEFEDLLRDSGEAAGTGKLDKKLEESQKRLILIADEDENCRREARETFTGIFDVLEASDNKTALKFMGDYEDELAAVILSMTLGGQDEPFVLETIQKERRLWSIPVIATSPADEQAEEKALELGVADFAGKPYSRKGIWKRVIRAMDMKIFAERERALMEEAYRDYMTGLLNRRGFLSAVRALRQDDAPLAVYLFDLDNLKEVNDTLGHAAGDRLISKFAQLLGYQTRGTDILARYGGDEFIVVMKQMNSEMNALKKGEDICKAISDIGIKEGSHISCSAGAVLWNGREPIDQMITQADQALYIAKKSGKGGCRL